MVADKKSKKELLRQRAEELLSKTSPLASNMEEINVQKLVHELQTHQIELEMQNEELREAQERIEESRLKYSDLYDFAPIGYFIFDPSGKILEVNLTGANLLGVERENLIHTPFSVFVEAECRSHFRDHCRNILNTGKTERCNLKLIKKDGESPYVSLQSIVVAGGENPRIRSAVSDITELKKAQNDAETEHAFRIAVENSILSGIAAVDLEGRQSYVNIGFCRMVGWGEEELLGRKPPFAYWPPEELDHVNNVLQTIMGGKASHEGIEVRLMRRNGERFDALILPSPLKDHQGKVIGWIATIGDITHLKKMETELKQLNTELEDRIRQRTVELQALNQQLRHEITERKRTEGRLTADLFALARMHSLSGRLLGTRGLPPLLQEIMDAAVVIVRAQQGTLQLLEGDSLRIVAHHGHQQPFVDFFSAAENVASVCGDATRRGERVVVQDVETSPLFSETPSLPVLREAGVRAVQSTPIMNRTGRLLGILTTQWNKPYSPDEHDLWRIDLLARQAADLIEYMRAEETVRRTHRELEKQVQERTSELSEAVERLRAENIHRKQLEDILRESEIQVRFFASQCLTAQETERKRVAGELHDSVAATLGAMKFRIDKIAEEMKQGNGSPESLQDLGSMVTEINNEVRRIMADLRPSILDDLGIIPAIDWLCREYQKTYSHISVEKQVGISEHEVPDSLKTPIFRICQEAMNNISKYSKASLVNLTLRKEDDKILLMIEDNGQGFDLNTVKKGMGLSTMKERALLSGGMFDLESMAGKGTNIRASWPF